MHSEGRRHRNHSGSVRAQTIHCGLARCTHKVDTQRPMSRSIGKAGPSRRLLSPAACCVYRSGTVSSAVVSVDSPCGLVVFLSLAIAIASAYATTSSLCRRRALLEIQFGGSGLFDIIVSRALCMWRNSDWLVIAGWPIVHAARFKYLFSLRA